MWDEFVRPTSQCCCLASKFFGNARQCIGKQHFGGVCGDESPTSPSGNCDAQVACESSARIPKAPALAAALPGWQMTAPGRYWKKPHATAYDMADTAACDAPPSH